MAWLAKGNIVAAVVNALWLVGLTAAWRHTGPLNPILDVLPDACTTLMPGGAATYRLVQGGPHEIVCDCIPSWDWHRAAVDPKRSRTISHRSH